MYEQDVRQSLVNDQQQGPAHQISIGLAQITRLHALMWDLDPKVLQPDNQIFPPATDPVVFYEQVKPVLQRHPLASKAEVRISGSGLHLLLSLDPPVELKTAAEQSYWDRLGKIVQSSLPADPHAQGINIMTRPVGAINSKNGRPVEVLRPGEPIRPEEVVKFVKEFSEAPFRQVAETLFGSQRVSPCPVCSKPNTRMDVLDRHGHCYGGCNRVSGPKLLDRIFQANG